MSDGEGIGVVCVYARVCVKISASNIPALFTQLSEGSDMLACCFLSLTHVLLGELRVPDILHINPPPYSFPFPLHF